MGGRYIGRKLGTVSWVEGRLRHANIPPEQRTPDLIHQLRELYQTGQYRHMAQLTEAQTGIQVDYNVLA